MRPRFVTRRRPPSDALRFRTRTVEWNTADGVRGETVHFTERANGEPDFVTSYVHAEGHSPILSVRTQDHGALFALHVGENHVMFVERAQALELAKRIVRAARGES